MTARNESNHPSDISISCKGMNGRKKENRRTQESEGYCYLHTVGWVCRRKKMRRKDDNPTK